MRDVLVKGGMQSSGCIGLEDWIFKMMMGSRSFIMRGTPHMLEMLQGSTCDMRVSCLTSSELNHHLDCAG